jgi:hypothetical protein
MLGFHVGATVGRKLDGSNRFCEGWSAALGTSPTNRRPILPLLEKAGWYFLHARGQKDLVR